MLTVNYSKGLYTATASVRALQQGRFQGFVSLMRDAGEGDPESTDYDVDASSPTEDEALEEAKALAHRILGEIEF